jgi:hypothetical protein
MLRPAMLIRTVAAIGDQTFKAHAAGGPKQVGADLALLNGPSAAALGASSRSVAPAMGELAGAPSGAVNGSKSSCPYEILPRGPASI